MSFPLEYHAEVLSDYAEAKTTRDRLLLTVLAALIGAFLLIQVSVRSWSLGLATFVAVLAAMSGGVIVIAATGMALSLGAIAALLGILAVASRGALILIAHYQALEREGSAFGLPLIARATRERLGFILATGLGTALAVAPAAALASLAGLESIGQVAWILLGGMLTTTAVNLCVLPAFYLMFGAGSATAESDLVTGEREYHAA
jgi:Cu/Ag efflux pump CusA